MSSRRGPWPHRRGRRLRGSLWRIPVLGQADAWRGDLAEAPAGRWAVLR